jgi:hypothetical protein
LTPADAGLAAEAWVVPQEEVTAFVEERGGTVDFAVVGRGEQPVVVARVDWVPSEPSPGTRLQVVVLDPTGQDAATTFWVSPSGVDVTIGWDGRYEVLADRYPWLGATRSMEDAYGNVESTMSVAFPPDGAGPLWLVAAFPRASAIGIARRNDEPIVGAFLTSDPVERDLVGRTAHRSVGPVNDDEIRAGAFARWFDERVGARAIRWRWGSLIVHRGFPRSTEVNFVRLEDPAAVDEPMTVPVEVGRIGLTTRREGARVEGRYRGGCPDGGGPVAGDRRGSGSCLLLRPRPCIPDDCKQESDLHSSTEDHVRPSPSYQIDQRVGDIDRSHDDVRPAIDLGRQADRQEDHQGRDRHRDQGDREECLSNSELEDPAREHVLQ